MKVEIHMSGPGHGHVLIDGVEVQVRSARVEVCAEKQNVVMLELLAKEVVFTGDVEEIVEAAALGDDCNKAS